MRRLTIEVGDPERASRRFEAAMAGHRQGAFLSLPSAEAVLRLFTARRWRLLEAIHAVGPVQIPCLARHLEWTEAEVEEALAPLLRHRIVQRAGEAVHAPYDEVRLELVSRRKE